MTGGEEGKDVAVRGEPAVIDSGFGSTRDGAAATASAGRAVSRPSNR